MLPLAKVISDHTPCVIKIGTSIPKAQLFRFENFWADQPGFLEMVDLVWNSDSSVSSSVTRIAAKFKLLRRVLKRWAKGISKLKAQLTSCKEILLILDKL
jgi:hypothetical protein